MSVRDQVTNLSPAAVTKAAIGVVDGVSDHKPAVQLHAVAAMYHLLCEELGLDVREELIRAGRMIRSADGKDKPEAAALRAYIRGEVK